MMSQPLTLQFEHADYQEAAVQAVVDVLDGQPRRSAMSAFNFGQNAATGMLLTERGFANCLHLSSEQLLHNIQAVQSRYNERYCADEGSMASPIAVSDALQYLKVDEGLPNHLTRDFVNLSIEMETGTGKTFTYLSTIHRLYKEYGFGKFIIAVPSVAIREGAIKNIEVTRSALRNMYDGQEIDLHLYSSKSANGLRNFATGCDKISVLVLNIDSFTKDTNIINQLREHGVRPIEFLQNTRPIVIIDEPQNFETEVRRNAIAKLNPLLTLRYSATHKNPYHCLYVLNPVQAYDLGLVKQIVVKGVTAQADANQPYIKVGKIAAGKTSAGNKIQLSVFCANGNQPVKLKNITVQAGKNDLCALTKNMQYEDVFVDSFGTDFESGRTYIQLSNGRVLYEGDELGGAKLDVMKTQIRNTIAAHFEKALDLHHRAAKSAAFAPIKVLSLFFIDKVANYRQYDEQGNASLGVFGQWFEEIYQEFIHKPKYKGLLPNDVAAVHNGYFSSDKTAGKNKKALWTDSKEGNSARDDDTYSLIMREKERLLGLDEPLQFIFSHSALREGWDNPNVFQICTLNERKSSDSKRQEIGRGLRLPVNAQGVRVRDKEVAVLTVVANESYDEFAQSLQKSIEDETSVRFTGRIKNADTRAKVRLRTDLSETEREVFDEIWARISQKVSYQVNIRSEQLIEQCVAFLGNKQDYPELRQPRIMVQTAGIKINSSGVGAGYVVTDTHKTDKPPTINIPNVYAYIQDKVDVSRSTIREVFGRCGRLQELFVNPQAFLDMMVLVINRALHHVLVNGVKYVPIPDDFYVMSDCFKYENAVNLASIIPQAAENKFTHTALQARLLTQDDTEVGDAFNCVPIDSNSTPEQNFARACESRKNTANNSVQFFVKLPDKFTIPTPVGDYNPDWALAVDIEGNTELVYFVAETKSKVKNSDELRGTEGLKIAFASKMFQDLKAQKVHYHRVSTLEELLERVE